MILTRAVSLCRIVPATGGRLFKTASRNSQTSLFNNSRLRSWNNKTGLTRFNTEAKSGWRSWEQTSRPRGFTGEVLDYPGQSLRFSHSKVVDCFNVTLFCFTIDTGILSTSRTSSCTLLSLSLLCWSELA